MVLDDVISALEINPVVLFVGSIVVLDDVISVFEIDPVVSVISRTLYY